MTYVLGIDVFNGNSDAYNFGTAYAEGIRYAFHKASQGWLTGPGGWQDWKFVGAINRMRASGILPGGYHWLLKGNGALQAQNFYASLQRVGGPRGLLCAVDVERNDWNLSLNPDTQTLRDFLAEWDRLSGGQPIFIYGAEWFFGPYMGNPTEFADRPLWWAGYYQRNYPTPIGQLVGDVTPGYFAKFSGWNSYAIRQWTSNGIVSGQASDCDIFFGTIDDLRAYTAPEGVPAPVPAPPPVKVGANVKEIQAAVHAQQDGIWGPDTDRRCELVRHRGPVRDLQIALGVGADGIWGPITQGAYDKAVRGVQAGLGVTVDGAWGPKTDQAYLAASPMR